MKNRVFSQLQLYLLILHLTCKITAYICNFNGILKNTGEKCKINSKMLLYYISFCIVRPQVQKVEHIRNWPCPVMKKQVKSFLHLVSYYQKFIINFASLAAPLHNLTCRHLLHHIQWIEGAEKAFQAQRQALCEEPVLIAPDFSKPFLLHTHASGTGLQNYKFPEFQEWQAFTRHRGVVHWRGQTPQLRHLDIFKNPSSLGIG